MEPLPYSREKHVRFVQIIKWSLLLLILLLVAAVVVWPLLSDKSDKRYKFSYSTVESQGDSLKPKILNPRLQGMDESNQPYNINASEIFQKNDDYVELKEINADMTLKDNSWVSLMADRGNMEIATKMLDLKGKVHLFFDNGFEFRTDAISISLQKGNAQGNKPVVAQGPAGVITADSIAIRERGEIVQFVGSVHVTLYPLTE